MTRYEKKLWYDYLSKYPVRFQRQKAIGDYIVDFYCAKASLALEIDGEFHGKPDIMEYDAKRTADLKRLGVSVVRISNYDVYNNFNGVCEMIDNIVEERISK